MKEYFRYFGNVFISLNKASPQNLSHFWQSISAFLLCCTIKPGQAPIMEICVSFTLSFLLLLRVKASYLSFSKLRTFHFTIQVLQCTWFPAASDISLFVSLPSSSTITLKPTDQTENPKLIKQKN